MSVETLPNCAPLEPTAAQIETTPSQEAVALLPVAPGDPQRDPYVVFLTDAYAVAEVTDPMLASLLSGMIGHEPAEVRPPWMGERREGLELCQRLLTYVRQELSDRRLDVSLGYIAVELGSLHGASGSPIAH